VCLPASILLNAPRLALGRETLVLAAVPWLLLAASVALVMLVARLLGADRAARACLLTQIPLGNTAFLGYALIPALAGKGALRYAVVYDQLGSFVILGTYGLLVVARESGGARPTGRVLLRRILTFPPFVALSLGVLLVPAELPSAVSRPLEALASTLLPIVGLAVGMQLRLRLPRPYLAPLGFGIVAKLLLVPLLSLGLCALLGIRGEARAAAVLESAMPTMMTTGALLSMAGLAPELAAAMVGYTTLLSMVTLPLWQRALS
jgi:predicted permease